MVSFYNYLRILSFLKIHVKFHINRPYGLIIKWKIAINRMLFLDWKWTRPNISGRNVFIQVSVQPRFVLFDQLNVMHPCMQSLHRIHRIVSSDSAFVATKWLEITREMKVLPLCIPMINLFPSIFSFFKIRMQIIRYQCWF